VSGSEMSPSSSSVSVKGGVVGVVVEGSSGEESRLVSGVVVGDG